MSELWHWITERAIGKTLAVVVLLAGLALSAFAWRAENDRAREEARAKTLESVTALAARIEQRLIAYELMLRAGASLFAATDSPTRAQWASFVEAFDLARTHPGVQGVAFAPRLQATEVRALEQRVRSEGFEQFRVWPTGPRAESSAILYIEPMSAANVRALGFDMLSSAERREAMHASRDSGRTTLTRSVGLVQDAGGERRAGVLLYRAVYGTGTVPDSIFARRAAHKGWVYAPFRPSEMMLGFGRVADPAVLVRLYETADADPRSLLYQDAAAEEAKRDWTRAVRVPIRALDRTWMIEGIRARGAPGALSFSSRAPWVLLVGGGLVSLLLSAVLWSMATTRDRAHRIAQAMTVALRRANEELDTRVRQRTEALSATNLQLRQEIGERQRIERERTDALERERARTAQLRALADAGLGIAELPDDQARLEHLADRARHVVACRHAMLLREAALGVRAVAVASVEPMSFANRRVLVEASRPWSDVPDDTIRRVHAASSGLDARAWPAGCSEAMIVPIRIGSHKPLARLVLLHGEGAHFSDEDEVVVHQLVLLVTAAMQTAGAVERERAARMDAEAANASKDEFLAIVSHELRTPLHAILGWLQVLERAGHHQGHMRRAVQVIRRNAEAQRALIDDLLDLARIEQGKLALDMVRLRLDRIVRDAVESQRQSATANSVSIELRVDARDNVLGDPGRLQQAVSNLLANSVKFSKAGGRISVHLHADNDGLALDVEDDGEGIDSELLPHVFERFRQGDPSSRRRQAGLGLGLALVKHIVEAHGGSVHARSEGRGKGASFRIRLPVLPAGDDRAPVWLGPFHGTDDARNPVLVIDDDPAGREAVASRLRDADFPVAVCSSVSGALAWLESRSLARWPAAIFCALELSDGDGYAFFDALRALEKRSGCDAPVPVAALAAAADGEERARVLEYGFAAHLAKPVSFEHLDRVFDRILGTERSERVSGHEDALLAPDVAAGDAPRSLDDATPDDDRVETTDEPRYRS